MAATQISVFVNYVEGDVMMASRSYSISNLINTKFTYKPAYVVPALATDVQVNLGDVVMAKVVYVESDSPIEIALDGNAMHCEGIFCITTTACALFITNNNITDANLKIIVLGV